MTGLHLPIEDYLLTPLHAVEADWIRSVLVSSCMRRFGFAYPAGVRPTANGTAVDPYTIMFRRYGVTEAQSVRIWGYHVPRGSGIAEKSHTVAQRKRTSSADEVRTLTGTDPSTNSPAKAYAGRRIPSGGCAGESDSAVHHYSGTLEGSEYAGDKITSEIKEKSFAESMADSRVRAVLARWSACMKAHGYRFADPLRAADLPSMGAPEPTSAEIVQAETDVACKAKTNVVGVWFAVESAYQRSEIKTNSEKLGEVKEQRKVEAADIQRLFRSLSASHAMPTR
ncbi:hypothetical protein [Streptomyces sp. NBC_01483]|uniref:hypothetical protein n=1 Tax=Streptomyces sp. NBC_01483 TaxID=2903883 RepID=UPI002E2F7472|nr:hypothetical protein [Streptomyces sp. NBC_01483]